MTSELLTVLRRFTDARTLSAQNQASDDITDSESKSDSSNDDHEESSKGSTADDSVDANLDAKPPVTQNSGEAFNLGPRYNEMLTDNITDVVGAYASLSLNASAVRPSELLQQPTSQRGMVVNESSLGPGRSPSSKQSRHRTVVSHDSDEKVISDRAAVKAGPSDKQSEDDLSMGLLPKRSVGSGTTNRKERLVVYLSSMWRDHYLILESSGKGSKSES